VPNQRRIEIELTTLCNLRCYNCDMSVRQAQSDGRMTLDQVRRFVDESLALSWDWSRIRLLGGEPTLHPEFLGVVEELARYHRHKPDCVIELVTNGYGTRVQAVLKAVPDWMRIDNSRKTSDRQEFLSFNEAPLDDPAFEAEDFSKGCFVTSDCGMGLSRHGYYPCVVAAGIDRVVGHGLGIRSLAEVKESDMRAELATFCRTCGYFKSRRNRAATVDHEVMSPYWREAYERFRSSPPDLAPL
jgi:MoaA/NifB/PqqE/SkfB family radical SAM enzyme